VSSPLRIANCSGFYGDRLSAAKEMVDDGPIDVLTGDWLAELTMLILSRRQSKHPGRGYARTFVSQMEHVMGTCLDRSIKVVSNAGGLDPDHCAEAVAEVAAKLGLAPVIAYVNGDNLLARLLELQAAGVDLANYETGEPVGDISRFLTANAYLGCFGIVEALTLGADIVITGRVTDAAVVCGPAAWHHGWARDNWDALAGAVVAGHAIECGTQVTGGNYSFFTEVPGMVRVGFPWAEVADDGSSLIGKHDGTGGEVSLGTVTSQLLYEIASPTYLGPDVSARFDTICLEEVGKDRVRIYGTKGEPPPSTLKVAMNEIGGYRKDLCVAITGLDIDEKARLVEDAFWMACPYRRNDFESVSIQLRRTDKPDPATNEEAIAHWRITLKDHDEHKVGRALADAIVEIALSTIPGFFIEGDTPSAGTPYGVYHPTIVPAQLVPQHVVILGGARTIVDSVAPVGAVSITPESRTVASVPAGSASLAPIGRLFGARSGDKGGNANVGIFARNDESWAWLDSFLDVNELRRLLPEIKDLVVDRYSLPALRSLNFVIHGLLEEGVASSTRQDAQAKGLGEWLRSRIVEIPDSLLDV
jgi:hypothetical protein